MPRREIWADSIAGENRNSTLFQNVQIDVETANGSLVAWTLMVLYT